MTDLPRRPIREPKCTAYFITANQLRHAVHFKRNSLLGLLFNDALSNETIRNPLASS
jgi:hypothetical protein